MAVGTDVVKGNKKLLTALEARRVFALALAHVTGKSEEEALSTIEIAKPEFGGFSSRMAFVLAKVMAKGENNSNTSQIQIEGKTPQELANSLAKALNSFFVNEALPLKAEAVGSYINVRAHSVMLFAQAAFPLEKKSTTAIVEGPSVNPNKPWHLGHLRNALLGFAIANLLEAVGYDVVRLDYINDLGLQVAESFWYWMHRKGQRAGKEEKTASGKGSVEEKFDFFVGKAYVEAHKLFESNTGIEKEVRALMKRLEGHPTDEFRTFIKRVVKAQRQTAYAYGIFHNYIVFESNVLQFLGKEGFDFIKSSHHVVKIDEGELKGCLAVDLSRWMPQLKQPYKVLLRSDGTPTYTGKDIIFHMWKFGLLKHMGFSTFDTQPNDLAVKATPGKEEVSFSQPVVAVNIVGNEQSFPQEVVKNILLELGVIKDEKQYIHVAYGRVRKKEGSFSGRKGTWLGFTADELLEEGKRRVEKGPKEKIALAAIKFSFLKPSARKDFVFDWNKALSFEGDSGVYLLYSLVRAKHILEKAESSKGNKEEVSNVNVEEGLNQLNDEEQALMRHIWLFPLYVEGAARSFEPNVVAEYLLDLSALFSRFYEKHKVIGSDEEAKRLVIVERFATTLEKGLALLGIEPVEDM